MSTYSITRSCGHVEAVQVRETNTHGEHYRQVARVAEEPCVSCRDHALNTVLARLLQMPDFTSGTPSERVWAGKLRVQMLAEIVVEARRRARVAGGTAAHQERLATEVVDIVMAVADRQTDARWWIDHRGCPWQAVADACGADDQPEWLAAARDLVATGSAVWWTTARRQALFHAARQLGGETSVETLAITMAPDC